MYKVSIFNAGVETVIHYPNPDKNAPHLLSLNLQEKLSQVNNLTFDIPYMNPGYNLIQSFSTKIKVINVRDNSEVFIGRVLAISNEMESDGVFRKAIVCEDALAYLIDSNSNQKTYTNQTPEQILNDLLNSHNDQVNDTSKSIHLGNIELNQPITISTNYESTLNVIIKNLVNILGGDIRVQERNGILYLDYLVAIGSNNNVQIRLGRNQQSLVVEYDPINILTRIIPLGYGEGINQLNIKSVNNGLNYIDNTESQSQYGVISNAVTNKDIQDAATLKIWGQTYLSQNSQPIMTVEADMLDLSTIGLDKPVSLGDTVETINNIMNFDIYARIVEKSTDLLNAYNPKLILNTKKISLSTQQVDLQQRIASLENAPQGSTCIFPLCKAENADADHPITFDLDIPEEAININKVYVNLHGRKYRAYEKDTASGGGSTQTSSNGGDSTQTSSSGGSSTQTSSSGGAVTTTVKYWRTPSGYNQSQPDSAGQFINALAVNGGYANLDYFNIDHQHSIPTHNHNVSIPAHTHSIDIPTHTHNVSIPNHSHAQIYGIFEGTYPKNTKISVNGEDIGVNYGDGTAAFDEYNIDITSKVKTGSNKVQISTEQNGRLDVIVYSQVFIQSR